LIGVGDTFTLEALIFIAHIAKTICLLVGLLLVRMEQEKRPLPWNFFPEWPNVISLLMQT
jgi:hypothetical protein